MLDHIPGMPCLPHPSFTPAGYSPPAGVEPRAQWPYGTAGSCHSCLGHFGILSQGLTLRASCAP